MAPILEMRWISSLGVLFAGLAMCAQSPDSRSEMLQRREFADRSFGTSSRRGSGSDRGRTLIAFGKPDIIKKVSADADHYPVERWKYNRLPGVGRNVVIEFVDPTLNGEFHMICDPAEREVSMAGVLAAKSSGPSAAQKKCFRQFALVQEKIRASTR
jgi:hypothetical protein